jgi:hypothetical protein
MKCPRCASTQLRKNGRLGGKQRYLCKACGRQFLAESSSELLSSEVPKESLSFPTEPDSTKNLVPLTSPQLSITESGTVQVATNEDSKPALLPAPSRLSLPEASASQLDGVTNPTQSPSGIAILLLDAENLRLDINTEKFLADVSNYPLRVKIAFANWRNHAIGKLDAELYERGYQLIHVPMGPNSADAQMIAMGVSISRHYPDAKEVFVCSCDWLLTHLCNELQSQGITVYRVRRQDNILTVENRTTGESREYSLTIRTKIPSFEEFIDKINELINAEHESLTDRIDRLSTVTALFQERRLLSAKENRSNSSLVEPQNQGSTLSVTEHESIPPNPEKVEVELKAPVPTISSPAIKSINSKEELELALIEIIESMKVNEPLGEFSVSKLSGALRQVYGEAGNALVKKLKLANNFTNFLKSCPTFKVEKIGKNYEVTSVKNFPIKLNSPKELEQLLVNIMKALQAKSPQQDISLEILGIEFHKQYRKPVSEIIKRLNLKNSFVDFVQSCSAFKVEKKGTGYQVRFAQP